MYREVELKQLFACRKILIAGYGREGKSSEALIRRLLPDADLTIVEGNDNLRREASKGYDMIVKSPGIPTMVLEGYCDLNTITSQTDIFLQVYGDQTIGITGTKGKSTTTNLMASVMREEGRMVVMAGNMGIPLFDVIDQINEQTVIVCEFSCHQLENIHRAPHVGVVLNLFEEHLDHYHCYRDYQMAKLNIGLKQGKGDYFYYCSDNKVLKNLVGEMPMESEQQAYSFAKAQRWNDLPRKIQGDHNLCNIEVVAEIAEKLGVKRENFECAVANFDGLEHRLELVGCYKGITFYNDSISTIPAAAIAAVRALKKVDTLIMGGFDRGIDYQPLADFLNQSEIRNWVFVGKAGERIKALVNETGRKILVSNDYDEIVTWCYEVTAKGKICLLSPAAASYDQFKNFEERGRRFKELIKQKI